MWEKSRKNRTKPIGNPVFLAIVENRLEIASLFTTGELWTITEKNKRWITIQMGVQEKLQ
jgi:hypothetical protein